MKQVTVSQNVNLNLPDVFLTYQKKLMQATSQYSVVICEKSRRIGVTWSIAADAVLTAAKSRSSKGMDVLYIGFNLDMTREFIDTCATWAKSFHHAAAAVSEFIFDDIDENNHTKQIQAFRIRFDSGYEIIALTSRPRSLRGRQGYVIIDEAAFHDDLKELMKAALALLIWGGKVLIISTHDGVSNPFNEYVQDARAKKNKYHVLRIDFDDALKDGLYKRVCLTTGKEWSPESEAQWRQEIIDSYGEGADEELFCVPRLSSGAYIPAILVESRMRKDIPVVRLARSTEWGQKPEQERNREIELWCEETLSPLLDKISLMDTTSYVGGDFARSGDLSVIWPIQVMQNMVRWTPFVVELKNIPFRQQLQILWYIMDRLPRRAGAAFDARGNGQQMAEETADRYGHGHVHQVMTSAAWYLEAFPPYKSALEDATFTLPQDRDIANDHRTVVMQGGIPQIPAKRTKGKDGNQRHGDSLVAAVMAHWASMQNIVEYDYTPANGMEQSSSLRNSDDDDDNDSGGRFSKGAY
ncbi:terminase large subunit domain-containing protein [Micavibrio aeruginosavorus]|uniref:terminase large subunit domain-containing protein n=1 Tax=Micavibrio aeruginosavorus TaxID=349221 RepID=UPI003F4A99B6